MDQKIIRLRKLWDDQKAISSVEYALLLALFAGGIAASSDLLGESVADQLDQSSALLDGSGGCHNNGGGDGVGQGKGQGGENTC